MANPITKNITENITKVTETIVKPVNQRLSNPLIGSFTLSWVILNWQPILFIIFSNQPIENKIIYIHTYFYGDSWYSFMSLCMYLIFPFLISLIYSVGIPRLENVLDKINLKPRDFKLSQTHELNLKEFGYHIRYAEKQAKIENTKANYLEVQDLNQKISLLNEQIQERNKTIQSYEDKKLSIDQNTKDEISKLKRCIYKEKRNKTQLIDDIINLLADDSIKFHPIFNQIFNIKALPEGIKIFIRKIVDTPKDNTTWQLFVLTESSSSVVSQIISKLSFLKIEYNGLNTDNNIVSLNIDRNTNASLSFIKDSLTNVAGILHVYYT